MRVDLARLENGTGSFTHEYAAGELLLDDERVLAGASSISGRISLKGQKVLVEGELSANAEVECDRCLQPVKLPIRSDFRLEYVTADTYKSLGRAELAEEDLALSIFDGQSIDLDEIVREQLLLAVPAQTICRENCKGFCPVCGADRNVTDCNCDAAEIDPRLSGLKDLRF